MLSKFPIGIIQTAPLAADFSNNLRKIVQGYRECLDHGARLVIAPAYALCGASLANLIDRKSFQRQTEAALKALSMELGETPLILGAYTQIFDDDFSDDPKELKELTNLQPYLLENCTVTELEDADTFELDDYNIYVDVNQNLTLTDTGKADLIIHLSASPWYAGAAADDEENGLWEARLSQTPVIIVHHVGTSGESIYGGGSAIYSPQGTTIARLPFFQKANKVINVNASTRARALPEETELLNMAMECGLQDSVRNNGYSGVCLNLDEKNAPLLATLCVQALGRSNVIGITTCGNTRVAKALGISRHEIDVKELTSCATTALGEESEALRNRLTNTLLFTFAEKRGLMMLSSLSRREVMLGNFTLYGESCGLLAPLANLYEMDLYLLCKKLSESYNDVFGTIEQPSTPETDRIIHELTDCNIGATELLQERISPFSENDVRMIQRRIIASALKRSQFPLTLRVDRPSERIQLPITHRLND